MLDIEYLKRKCFEYSTPELIEVIFLQSEQFVPEALEIYKNELLNRVSDIEDFLNKEFLKTGSIEHIIFDVHAPLNSDRTIKGDIYLTTNGLFFIQKSMVNENILTHGAGGYIFGPLGVIIDEIASSISERNISIEAPNSNLPLSLVVDLSEYSYVSYLINVDEINYWSNGKFQIVNQNMKKREFYFEESHLTIFVSWINSHSIPSMHKTTVWNRIISIFR